MRFKPVRALATLAIAALLVAVVAVPASAERTWVGSGVTLKGATGQTYTWQAGSC